MDNALYVGLSKQMLLERELDITANNLANANTTGFKVEALMSTPDPVTIQLSDIDEDNYLTGRKWENMLVQVNDVTVGPGVNSSNRVSYIMGQGDASIDINAAGLSNELYDLGANDYPAGTHFSSVTGIVTWFYSYHIAPRSAADLKQ